jgi:hypothetical protein
MKDLQEELTMLSLAQETVCPTACYNFVIDGLRPLHFRIQGMSTYGSHAI